MARIKSSRISRQHNEGHIKTDTNKQHKQRVAALWHNEWSHCLQYHHRLWAQVWAPAAPLLIQLPANVTWKAAADDTSATHMGDPEAPGMWFGSSACPVPAVTAVWEANPWMEYSLSLSLCNSPFQIKCFCTHTRSQTPSICVNLWIVLKLTHCCFFSFYDL